tara:strand:+ start:2299 stop:2958 length:660 start_codon:yes stop_codon:yes gene_type:complete
MALEQFGLPLFPTPLGVYNMGEPHNRQDKELIDAILLNRDNDPNGVVSSQVHGWHSGNLIGNEPCFEELCALVETYAADYAQQFGLEGEITVPGCWANINQYGDYNMPHHHNGNSLAGVYYPCAAVTPTGEKIFNYKKGNPVKSGAWENKGGELVLQSPHYHLYHGTETKPNNPFTITHYHVVPQGGILLLFPPYLVHSVVPVYDDNLRISISFYFGQY